MNNKNLYVITTGLYFGIGVIALFFFFYSIIHKNIILGIVSALSVYVAFDNVTCRSRKDRYLKRNKKRS